MIKSLLDDMRNFVSSKVYCIIVFVAAVWAYGFQMTHVAIGIDDTAISLYFEEGLAPAMGRWPLFIINKMFHLSDFTPWMTDVVGVFLMIIAAVIWCVLLYRFLGEEVPVLGYTFFSALFVTCPLISEVYVYYLHNGTGLGYMLSALSMLLVQQTLEKDKDIKARCRDLLGSSLLMLTAIGCYESFVVVFCIGALLLFVARRFGGMNYCSEKYYISVWRWGLSFGIPLVAAILLRKPVVSIICKIFGLSIPEHFIFGEFRGAAFGFDGNSSELAMYFKRYWVKFYLNGLVYLPITVLVFGIVILLILCVGHSIKEKDLFVSLAALIVPMLPAFMIFVEGKEAYYRACQYVPLVGAFSVLLLFRAGQAHLPIWGKRVGVLLAAALLWNQCADMNKWFYVDYMKYEYFENQMRTVMYDLERGYDMSKPVIFGGLCGVPYSIMEDACVGFNTPQYKCIKTLGDMADPHLIEKYNESEGRGYVFAETPTYSTLQWGITAFDGTSREIQSFLRMLGYQINIETDLQKIEDVLQIRSYMPHFPQEGYIREEEDCIIVNF